MTAPDAARELPGWRDALVGIAHVVYLEVLWLVGCCLVVTAPAATAAMTAAVHRWRVDGEAPDARRFLGDVRARLAPDLLAGSVVVAIATFLVVDLAVIGRMGEQRRVFLVLWLACTIGLAVAAVFAPVAAAAQPTGPARRLAALRDGARLAARRPLQAVAAVVVCLAAAALVTVSPITLLVVGVATAAVVDRLASGRAERR